jgi:hypothetical protein
VTISHRLFLYGLSPAELFIYVVSHFFYRPFQRLLNSCQSV